MFRAEEIEQKIGYRFRDRELLHTCFTHASCGRERSNERLEFLGDAVLGYLVSDALYSRRAGSEGDMTAERARMVSQAPLAAAVRGAGLDAFLLAGSGAHVGEKGISSLFEALVAGIYLDGGMEEARQFVERLLLPVAKAEPNYKGALQEWLQARGLERAQYSLERRTGEDHDPHFVVRADAAGASAVGEGGSLRAAEKAAARALLEQLVHRGESR